MTGFCARRFILGTASIIAISASAAFAQENTDEANTDETIMLDRLVITGEKKPRLYTETFSSVGVATSQDIQNFQLDNLEESFRQMGNVRWFDRSGGNNGFVIRGINSEGVSQPSNNAPVASVIIDGATQSVEGVRRGSRGLWDVKQVEVFRGPQSMLQGRAALAGAVIVETNDPTYHWEGAARGILAEDERRDGAFVLSGPILQDQVAFRISGAFKESEKDIAYVLQEESVLAEEEFRNIRGKLLFEPAELPGLTAKLTVSHTFDKPANATVNAPFEDRTYVSGFGTELRETTNNNYVADVTYEYSDTLTIQSVSSYVDTQLDISSPAADVLQRVEDRKDGNFTQDVRLLVGNDDTRLSGVVGGFYGNLNYQTDSVIEVPSFGLVVPFALQDLETTAKTTNASVYGDLRYKLTDSWSLLGGARLMYESVENVATGTGVDLSTFMPVVYNVDSKIDDTVILPSIGLAYDFNDNHSVALTAKRGYRSGFTEVVQDLGTGNTVLPEDMWAFELAYRASSSDDRWTFGASAFYYDYDNQQIPVFLAVGSPFVRTVNAGSSHSYGAELEGRYNFDNGLSMFGSVGLLQTRFDRLVTNQGDYSDNRFPEAPNFTAALGANYKHESGAFVGFDASYTSSYFSVGDLSNDPTVEVDGHWIANARVGYEAEHVKLTAFVDNLFDQKYVTSIASGGGSASVGDRRKFGLELTGKF